MRRSRKALKERGLTRSGGWALVSAFSAGRGEYIRWLEIDPYETSKSAITRAPTAAIAATLSQEQSRRGRAAANRP
jgi:hypothetical protein